MSGSEESNTRPLSVAELLARNGTIGSPPVSGRRRRRGRNNDGISVAELTGEIPIIRTGEIPIVGDEVIDDQEYEAEYEAEYSGAYEEAEYEEAEYEEAEYQAVEYEELQYEEVRYEDEEAQPDEAEVYAETYDSSVTVHEAPVEAVVYEPEEPEEEVVYAAAEPLPRSSDPLPRRTHDGLQLSHDPRPQRRSSGAEEMAYDPVDESVDISELVDQNGAEELRSYLQASSGTLFSGGTVADDLARRGLIGDVHEDVDYDDGGYREVEYREETPSVAPVATESAPRRIVGGVVALLQSLLAVVLGAGLFIGFDHLWRWNNLVALVLTVLVVLSLAAGVRLVRKTEDIVSTLTAVAVGLLVTLGPLALQST